MHGGAFQIKTTPRVGKIKGSHLLIVAGLLPHLHDQHISLSGSIRGLSYLLW